MKTIITYAKYVVFIIVTAFAVDARYGLESVQAENTAGIELINLKRQEDVFQERYFDLARQYGPTPTHEQKLAVEEAEVEWKKKQKAVDRALGIVE